MQSSESDIWPWFPAEPGTSEFTKQGSIFNQSLQPVALPSSLQSLTLGQHFKRSVEQVALPESLRTLTIGGGLKRKLEEVSLSSSLQSLTFLDNFGQSLKGVTLPSSLHSLTFGNGFDRSLERVTLPSNFRSLACGEFFNHSLEHVMLPSSLRRLVFGRFFNQPLQRVTSALSSLESLTVGISLKRVLEGVAPPNSLQSLSCAWVFFWVASIWYKWALCHQPQFQSQSSASKVCAWQWENLLSKVETTKQTSVFFWDFSRKFLEALIFKNLLKKTSKNLLMTSNY